jgi:hypothetical protein
MTQPFIMMTSFSQTETDSTSSLGHINMMVVYEDFSAGKRAQTACQQIINLAHGDGILSTDLWKFDMLKLRHMRESATEEAAKADLVVIALQDGLALEPTIFNWARLILKQPTRPKALLVLLDPESAELTLDLRLQEQLTEFASQIPVWCLQPEVNGEWWVPGYDTDKLAQIAQRLFTPMSATVSAA